MLRKVADALFPPSDEARLVESLTEREVRTLLQPTVVSPGMALSRYSDPRVRALIHEAKFHESEKAFALLGVLVKEHLSLRMEDFDIVVPLPLSQRRLLERGYNQVDRVLALVFPTLPVQNDVLKKTQHTKPQTSLDREHRLRNVGGAFEVKDSEAIRGKRILLIDDVVTTGATMRAARAALLSAEPASVTCLALAH